MVMIILKDSFYEIVSPKTLWKLTRNITVELTL